MKQFEYRVFNLSEVDARNKILSNPKVTWINLLCEYGLAGWEYTGTQPTKNSFLLKREITK